MKNTNDNIQFLKKVYNTYARQYNQSTNKIDITNSFSERGDKLAEGLRAIQKDLESYGFTPEYLRKIALAIKDKDEAILTAHNTVMQDFADRNNLTEQEYHKAVKQIAEYGRQYEQTEINLLIIQRMQYVTAQNGYPENIPLWDELIESEQAEITKRGNPNFVGEEMPDGFFERADQLRNDNPEQSQNWIVFALIREFFDGNKSKKTTVYRRLFDKKTGYFKK